MIRQQLVLVIAMFGMGILIMFAYDILLMLREVIRRAGWMIVFENMIFWFACAIAVFLVIYRLNEGMVRGYVAISLLAGMWIFHWSIGKRMVITFTNILGKIRKHLKKVFYRCKMNKTK